MNDIRPPRRPTQPIAPRQPPQPVSARTRATAPKPVPMDHRIVAPKPELRLEAPDEPTKLPATTLVDETPTPQSKKRWSWRRWAVLALGIILLLTTLGLVAGYMWYQQSLSPVSNDTTRIQVTVEAGSTPTQIGDLLIEKKLIRNKTAFDIHTRLSGTQNKLQAGSYRLSPSESTPAIVEHLVSGKIDQFTLTFFPGAMLTDATDKPEKTKVDVTTVLMRAGYKEDEIRAALNKKYTHPLLATKPASADLEGYIYGETYSFPTSASVEDIIQRTLDEFYTQVKKNNIVEELKKSNMTLHEGIILSSVIQREEQRLEDQQQVARVFLNRLDIDMPLGSDPTYQYGAMKLGVEATPDVDSPYNTRRNAGLPPGPIAVPNITALQALIHPSDHEYLYFLSGDDDKLYFARTNEQHERNITTHCKVKCFSY